MNLWSLGIHRIFDDWLLEVDWLLLNWLGNNGDKFLFLLTFVILFASKCLIRLLSGHEILDGPEMGTHEESQDKFEDLASLTVVLSMLSVLSVLAMLSMESMWTLLLSILFRVTSVELLGNTGLNWGASNNNWFGIVLKIMFSIDSWSSVVSLSTMRTSVMTSSSVLFLILIIFRWSSSVMTSFTSHSINEIPEESWFFFFFFFTLFLEVFFILSEEGVLIDVRAIEDSWWQCFGIGNGMASRSHSSSIAPGTNIALVIATL